MSLFKFRDSQIEAAEMTQAELDALPETGGDFGRREIVVDGKCVVVPVPVQGYVLFHKPGDPLAAVDACGQRWIIG